jgi:hypothetical protein
MQFLKILTSLISICLSSDTLAAKLDFEHAGAVLQSSFINGIYSFIYNNYLLSIFLILVITIGFDFYYYNEQGLQIKISRFSVIIAIIGIMFFTLIKLTY